MLKSFFSFLTLSRARNARVAIFWRGARSRWGTDSTYLWARSRFLGLCLSLVLGRASNSARARAGFLSRFYSWLIYARENYIPMRVTGLFCNRRTLISVLPFFGHWWVCFPLGVVAALSRSRLRYLIEPWAMYLMDWMQNCENFKNIGKYRMHASRKWGVETPWRFKGVPIHLSIRFTDLYKIVRYLSVSIDRNVGIINFECYYGDCKASNYKLLDTLAH